MNFTRGSKFKREYLNPNINPIDYDCNIVDWEEQYDFEKDEHLDIVERAMEYIGYDYKMLFENYAEGENISEFSRNSGIPRKTLINLINKVKHHFKTKIEIHDFINSDPADNLPNRVQQVWQLELF